MKNKHKGLAFIANPELNWGTTGPKLAFETIKINRFSFKDKKYIFKSTV